jgi:translation initiation factor 1 (eIF-1/SUI1)
MSKDTKALIAQLTATPSAKTASSSMKDIVDDIIKGAEQNTFGRRVNIQQGFDPSPIDMAKFAGALTAYSELGYSVKEAAEALGLTEKQVQHIIATVR